MHADACSRAPRILPIGAIRGDTWLSKGHPELYGLVEASIKKHCLLISTNPFLFLFGSLTHLSVFPMQLLELHILQP